MSIVEVRAEAQPENMESLPIRESMQRPLHRIREIRRQQGVSLRTCARRMGTTMQQVREQENVQADMLLSDLYRWQRALEVPIADLLVDMDGPLSTPVLQRARLLKMMKTALSIRASTQESTVGRLVQTLIDQLVEVMPELEDVSPWHTVGQRRTLDEVGRVAEQVIPERMFFDSAG